MRVWFEGQFSSFFSDFFFFKIVRVCLMILFEMVFAKSGVSVHKPIKIDPITFGHWWEMTICLLIYNLCKTVKKINFIFDKNNCFEWNHKSIQCGMVKSLSCVLLLFVKTRGRQNGMRLCPSNRKKWKSVWLTKRSDWSLFIQSI